MTAPSAPNDQPTGSEAVDPIADGPVTATGGRLGSPTWLRALVLGVTLGLLGGAIGWAIGSHREPDDGLSSNDIGFLRDMYAHHGQAIQMSKIALAAPDVSAGLKSYAVEFLTDQSFERGVFNTILSRAGLATDEPNETAMGWMGAPVPVAEMAGMATEAQMNELQAATGRDAEALFIALMSEHHLGGLHMADYEVRHGKDKLVRRLALAALKSQRAEVIELNLYRKANNLPIPAGFTDPTQDPRLNPIGLQVGSID